MCDRHAGTSFRSRVVDIHWHEDRSVGTDGQGRRNAQRRIGACEYDPLLNDSERLAARASTMGVRTELRVWKGMVHAAVSLMGWIDALGPEVDRIGDFLRRVTGAS